MTHVTDTERGTNPPVAAEQAEAERRRQTGYDNPNYHRVKSRVIEIIPRVSILEAIDKYAGHISLGIFGIALGNIFKQESSKDPLKNRTTLWLAGTALGTALLGIYAHYKKYRLAVPADIDHKEGYTKATADLTGQAIADSLRPYLRPEHKRDKHKEEIGDWTRNLNKDRTEHIAAPEQFLN